MDGATLKTLTEDILGGRSIGETLFYQLLNIARVNREMKRPWVILRYVDSSQTISASDGITNTKSLPSGFLMTFNSMRSDGNRTALHLQNGDDDRYPLEIPFGTQQEQKDDDDLFFINLASSVFALTGTRDKSYTAYLNYIKNSGDIASSSQWVFPSGFHAILAYDVAAMHKGGIDYDDVNARMTPENRATAQAIVASMVKWDDTLLRNSLGV